MRWVADIFSNYWIMTICCTVIGSLIATGIMNIHKVYVNIMNELWEKGFSIQKKNFIKPQYTIENNNQEKKRIDRLLAGMLLKCQDARIFVVSGDVGTGKSFLIAKVYQRLVFRIVRRKIDIEIVNAGNLSNLLELESRSESKRSILLLDNLEEYYEFIGVTDDREIEKIFDKLCRVVNGYSRIMIAVREDFYTRNKEHIDGLSRGEVLGGQRCILVTLSQPTDKQIQSYYRRNLKLKHSEIKKCMELIHSSCGLLGRPLFLPFVTFLPTSVRYTDSYTVYNEIVGNWLKYEANRCSTIDHHIRERELEKAFDRITVLYFYKKLSKKNRTFFQANKIGLDIKSKNKKIFQDARFLLRYDVRFGYFCAHKSFLEFNYVRMNYNRIYKNGLKQKEKYLGNLSMLFMERHYHETFSENLPDAELVLYTGQEKSLAELKADEVNLIKTVRVLCSEDLVHEGFQRFILGLFSSEFLLGSNSVKNSGLRRLLFHGILKVCDMEVKSIKELEWFHNFPVRSLNISHTGIHTLLFLKSFPRLEKLISVGNPLDVPGGLDGLVSCNCLTYVNLANCRLESGMLKNVLPSSLKSLILSNNELTELSFIKPLRLDYLDISDNPLYTGIKLDIEFPTEWRCAYHFESRQLREEILGEKEMDGYEITYWDITRFLEKKEYRLDISKNKFSSICGLENIYFEHIHIPIRSADLLSRLRYPLHTDRIAITAEHECKVGYVLNELLGNLYELKPLSLGEEDMKVLFNCCNNVLSYFAVLQKEEGKITIKNNEEILKLLSPDIWSSCIDELIYLAAFSLKSLQESGIHDFNRLREKEIFPMAASYLNNNELLFTIRPDDYTCLKNVTCVFREQGKIFKKGVDTVIANTKKPLKLLWYIGGERHTEQTIEN